MFHSTPLAVLCSTQSLETQSISSSCSSVDRDSKSSDSATTSCLSDSQPSQQEQEEASQSILTGSISQTVSLDSSLLQEESQRKPLETPFSLKSLKCEIACQLCVVVANLIVSQRVFQEVHVHI